MDVAEPSDRLPPDSSRLMVKHSVATGIALSAVQQGLRVALHCIIQARPKTSPLLLFWKLSPFPRGGVFVWPGITCHLYYF